MPRSLQRPGLRGAGLAAVVAIASACGGVRSCAGPPTPTGQFLYVVHDPPPGEPAPGADPRIATFRADPVTGSLSRVGRESLAARAVGAFALATDSTGRWFTLTGSQLGLQRLGASGALERVDIDAPGLAASFDPRGRYLFVVDGRGLAVHAVDARRGPDFHRALHREAGVFSPSIQANPDGTILYAVTEDTLRSYAIDDGGHLRTMPGSPASLGMRGFRVMVHPSGRLVLVLGEARGRRVIAVLRHGVDGDVAPVDGSPVELGANVQALALSADGARLFVADDDRRSIETFGLDADGGLHGIASTPGVPSRIRTLRADAEGRFLYATASDEARVYGWAIDGDGALTAVPGAPFAVDGHAGDLQSTPRRHGPLQAAALPDASTFGAEPEHFDLSNPFPRDTPMADLVARLADPSGETRFAAILALGQQPDLVPALPALVAALDDPGEGVQTRARHLLGPWALTHPGDIDDAVLDRLVNGKTGRGAGLDNASLCALKALIKRGPPASPYLARTLLRYGQLRDEALAALRDMGSAAKPAVPELIRLLDDASANRHAAYVLGAIGPDAAEAVPALYGLVSHPSKPVAAAARDALARIRR